MKFDQILEAKYHRHGDTKCLNCNHRFDFDDIARDQFWKDYTYCPSCNKPVPREEQTRQQLRKVAEARYAGHKDEQWLHDIKIIADGNLKRNAVGRPGEIKYWEGYKDWAEDNREICQKMYDQMKSDRDRFIEVAQKMPELGGREGTAKIWTDALRMRQAEIWSGNIDQHDYPMYWKMIEDDNPAYHDYTIMASNTMIDILGGLRDERS